jgi:deoxyribodipyrimidine photolyase-related protein
MEATLIYPHQLFPLTLPSALTPGRLVYLIEEPLILTHNPIHRAKLIFHRLSMQAYATSLREAGYTVRYIEYRETNTTDSILTSIVNDGVITLHIADTTDYYLEQAITYTCEAHGISRTWYESPSFMLPKAEATTRYESSRRHMANFYKAIRQSTGILMDGAEAVGGAWSFDSENRKKLPKGIVLPVDITPCLNTPEYEAALVWLQTIQGELYGEPTWYLPITTTEAEVWFKTFLTERFANFGPYEDALTTRHARVYHSLLSPLLNCGLLTPTYVVTTALDYAKKHDTPIASVEGFIRQIIGWREFIRASYEVDGVKMRTSNFFKHTNLLPRGSWDATTGILPLDYTIKTALRFGYTHHIERLMVAGNFFLLAGTHPDEVYRWFMGMYIDAYDWVMVPNVYSMSQFADGGIFATKPYISGAAYLKKMSDYPGGDWEATWTALYWNFIHEHETVFRQNHRLAMMPRLLENMSKETRTLHLRIAKDTLTRLTRD